MLTVIKAIGKCIDLGESQKSSGDKICAGYTIAEPTSLRFHISSTGKKPEVHIRADDGYEFKIPDPKYQYEGDSNYFDIRLISVDPPTWMMNEANIVDSAGKLRRIIIEELAGMLKEVEKKKSKIGTYNKGDKHTLMLDRPTQHGGWPEGEYDPPINQKIYDYLKSLGLVESVYKEHNINIIKRFIREVAKE
tara:strand:+ start:4730 stop:5305 length:576 start_codon:yes stop_codon:yes gene_type:complete